MAFVCDIYHIIKFILGLFYVQVKATKVEQIESN